MTDLAQPKSYRLATLQPKNCIETLNACNSLSFHPKKKAKMGHLERPHRDLSLSLIKSLFDTYMMMYG
jgi:hypothetical protein